MTRNPETVIATYLRNPGARACAGTNPDRFFPDPADHAAITAAQTICAACTVRPGCLEYALHHHITDGIWGGKSERERRTIRSARAKARGGGRGGPPVIRPKVTGLFRVRPCWTIPQLTVASGCSSAGTNRAVLVLAAEGRIRLRGDRIDGARVWEWVSDE